MFIIRYWFLKLYKYVINNRNFYISRVQLRILLELTINDYVFYLIESLLNEITNNFEKMKSIFQYFLFTFMFRMFWFLLSIILF